MFALIVANPNSDELGEIVSRHRSEAAAIAARSRLASDQWRWAYVAGKRPNGTYPLRGEWENSQ